MSALYQVNEEPTFHALSRDDTIWWRARRHCQSFFDYKQPLIGNRMLAAIVACEKGRISLDTLNQQTDALIASFEKKMAATVK